MTFADDGSPVFTFETDQGPERVVLGRAGEAFAFTEPNGTTRAVATLVALSIDPDGFRYVLRIDQHDRLGGLDIRRTATVTTAGCLELDEVLSVEEDAVTTGSVSRDGTPLPRVATPVETWRGVLLRD